jgi:hypothetical protein
MKTSLRTLAVHTAIGSALVAAAVFTAPTPAHASTWELLQPPVATPAMVAGTTTTLAFVERSTEAARPGVAPQRWLLRSFDSPQSLGGLYPHRSAKLRYAVDCGSRAVALTDWTFHEGSLGDGRVVWADSMGATVYVQPVAQSVEAQLVLATCGR